MMVCSHKQGAWVPDIALWICGDCFKKLADRPKVYSNLPAGGKDGIQHIVWQAEVKVSEEGTTLNQFLRAMAERFMAEDAALSIYAAYSMSIDAMQGIGDPWPDASYDWSLDSARDMAVEEICYWEHSGANA